MQVWSGEQRLALGGPRQLTLFAVLVLDANRAVSSDALIDTVWGPARSGADNRLKQAIARLRQALVPLNGSGEPVLRTVGGGYLLSVAPGELDAEVFEARVREGRHALDAGEPGRAAELLHGALTLWRGPPLAELAFEDFAQPELRRLEELRLVALEARVDAELQLGRHAALIGELEGLLAQQPTRERVAGQLMLALYRCSRQADALDVYQRIRAHLAQELGLQPAPALRELQTAILSQDPSLAPASGKMSPATILERPRTSSAPLAQGCRDGPGLPASPRVSSPFPLVGRSAELERLDAESPGDRRSATGEGPPHNMPVELTSFVGRERELREISLLLGDARLLTVTGAGGSGKTRLAMRAAREAIADYPDGVWLVELAALVDPALVAKSLAITLGVQQEDGPLIEALRRRFQAARILVVLDNCEHLLSGCVELAHELLTACDGLRILATSREPLRATGEVTWFVPGLSLPENDAAGPADELVDYAAIRLFTERARAVKPEFTLDEGGAEAVVRVCRRLDGMPLAIELAAARVRSLSPREILERLDDRFSLLTGGSRDALVRQQTLRATVAWSHELMSPSERTLFRRLSVFAGGWLFADAERVCADDDLPAEQVLDLLCGLVEKSLVVAEPTVGAVTRYRLLETLRDYAREQLTAAGEDEVMLRRHFDHFLAQAESAYEQTLTSGSDAGIAPLATQLENLRAGLVFARAADPQGLMRMATAMKQLWVAGNLGEGRRWLEEALDSAPEPTLERARALQVAVAIAGHQQDHANVRTLAEENLALSGRLNYKAGEAWARQSLGWNEWAAGDYDAALRDLRQSLSMHRANRDRLGVCRSEIFLATAMTHIPDSRKQGRIELKRALHAAHELGDAYGEGWAHVFLGFAEADAGDDGLAATNFRAGLLTKALGAIRAAGLEGLAQLSRDRDPRRAITLLGAAAAHRERHAGVPPPHLRRRQALTRAQAEAQIGAAEAHNAWNEGFRMTTDEAIAYSLGESQRDVSAP